MRRGGVVSRSRVAVGPFRKRAHACKSRAISEPPGHRPVVGKATRGCRVSIALSADTAVAPRRAGRPRRGGAAAAAHRARVRPPAGARSRRADALVADRVRARLHAAPFPLEQISAMLLELGVVPPHGKADRAQRAARRRRGTAARRAAAFAAAQRRARAAQHLSSPTGCTLCCCCCFDMASCSACMCSCSTIGMCVEELDACCSDRAAATGTWAAAPCASGAVASSRAEHPRCRPGPRAAVARPAAVCVRRLPPRAEVRATPRTQPLTAHAHVLTVCCVCACAQAETRPLLCRRPRRRRLCPPAPPPRRRAAAPPRRRSPQRPPPRRPPPCPPSHRQSAESLRRAASPIRRACAHA